MRGEKREPEEKEEDDEERRNRRRAFLVDVNFTSLHD